MEKYVQIKRKKKGERPRVARYRGKKLQGVTRLGRVEAGSVEWLGGGRMERGISGKLGCGEDGEFSMAEKRVKQRQFSKLRNFASLVRPPSFQRRHYEKRKTSNIHICIISGAYR